MAWLGLPVRSVKRKLFSWNFGTSSMSRGWFRFRFCRGFSCTYGVWLCSILVFEALRRQRCSGLVLVLVLVWAVFIYLRCGLVRSLSRRCWLKCLSPVRRASSTYVFSVGSTASSSGPIRRASSTYVLCWIPCVEYGTCTRCVEHLCLVVCLV